MEKPPTGKQNAQELSSDERIAKLYDTLQNLRAQRDRLVAYIESLPDDTTESKPAELSPLNKMLAYGDSHGTDDIVRTTPEGIKNEHSVVTPEKKPTQPPTRNSLGKKARLFAALGATTLFSSTPKQLHDTKIPHANEPTPKTTVSKTKMPPRAATTLSVDSVHTITATPTATLYEQPKDSVAQLAEQLKKTIDRALFNELSFSAKTAYLYRLTDAAERKEYPGDWILQDKGSATVYVISESGSLLSKQPDLLGATVGNDFNSANPTSTKDQFGFTPPGYYAITQKGITPAEKKKYGANAWRVDLGDASQHLFLHDTTQSSGTMHVLGQREALQSRNSSDNRMTSGSISIPNFGQLATHLKEGTRIIITPDNENGASMEINPENHEYSLQPVNQESPSLYPTLIRKLNEAK